jgi:hypothetical protein
MSLSQMKNSNNLEKQTPMLPSTLKSMMMMKMSHLLMNCRFQKCLKVPLFLISGKKQQADF